MRTQAGACNSGDVTTSHFARVCSVLLVLFHTSCHAALEDSPPAAAKLSQSKHPRASLVAFERDGSRLWTVQSDGSGAHDLFPGRPGLQLQPTWSPDGSQIAFTDELPGRPALLFVADANGANIAQVSTGCVQPNCVDDHFPDFAPDGHRIAFARIFGPEIDGHPRASGIAIVDRRTSSFTQLTSVPWMSTEDKTPRWSPDGRHIVFYRTTRDPATDQTVGSAVFIIDDDGRNLRRLTQSDIVAGDADWSPDGTTIVFSSWPLDEYTEALNQNIYTIGADGKSQIPITSGAAGSLAFASPQWARAGSHVLLTRLERGKGSRLDLTLPNGSSPAAVVPFEHHLAAHASWQPTR